MLLKPISIPRGVANIFVLGLSNLDVFNEKTQYRPDKLHAENGTDSMTDEITDNYMSVVSPIEARKGTGEILTDSLFKSYFGVLS